MALSSRYSSRPVLSATRARSGRYGRHVFWVLLASTILAALGLFFAWGLRSDDLASTEAANKPTVAEAAASDAPAPAAPTP
jgi:hypothetical protein